MGSFTTFRSARLDARNEAYVLISDQDLPLLIGELETTALRLIRDYVRPCLRRTVLDGFLWLRPYKDCGWEIFCIHPDTGDVLSDSGEVIGSAFDVDIEIIRHDTQRDGPKIKLVL